MSGRRPSTRELRRQAERSERLARNRRPRTAAQPRHNPLLVGTYLVFSPLQAILDQIDHDGTLTCNPQGVPIFQDSTDGRWWHTAPALAGVIDHLEMYETRHGVPLPVQSLREFHKRLTVSMPIDTPLMDRLKRDVPQLQRVIAMSDPDDIVDLFNQCRIKFELETLHGTDQTPDQPVA